jgi:hypothetical protein
METSAMDISVIDVAQQEWDIVYVDSESDEDPQTVVSFMSEGPHTKKIYQLKTTPETIDRIDLLVSGGDRDDPLFSLKLVPLNAIISIIPDAIEKKVDKDGEIFNGYFNSDHNKIVIHKYEVPRLEKAIADGCTHFPMIVYFSSPDLSMYDVVYDEAMIYHP